jgi:hypothetical protein
LQTTVTAGIVSAKARNIGILDREQQQPNPRRVLKNIKELVKDLKDVHRTMPSNLIYKLMQQLTLETVVEL